LIGGGTWRALARGRVPDFGSAQSRQALRIQEARAASLRLAQARARASRALLAVHPRALSQAASQVRRARAETLHLLRRFLCVEMRYAWTALEIASAPRINAPMGVRSRTSAPSRNSKPGLSLRTARGDRHLVVPVPEPRTAQGAGLNPSSLLLGSFPAPNRRLYKEASTMVQPTYNQGQRHGAPAPR
jgi:hypothetical protein